MMKFSIVEKESKCKELWAKFSSQSILWDLWESRYLFHDKNFKFHFIVCQDKNEVIGLLPLVYEKKGDIYTYFGDTFPEQNKFFRENKDHIKEFFDQIPEGTSMYCLDKSFKSFPEIESGEKRFFLDLRAFYGDIENYFKTFNKKHRKNLRYDLRKLEGNNFRLKINDLSDYEKLVQFNILRFGKDSDFSDNNFVKSMKNLMLFADEKGMLRMISLQQDKDTEAVGLGIIFNKKYYVVGSGRNVNIENLGKMLICEQIKDALSHNCVEIDFLATESGWKELWNLDSEQMYELYK